MMDASIGGIAQTVKQEKWLSNLENDMSPIMQFIRNKSVTDIAIGHEGRVIVEEIGMGKTFTDIVLDETTTRRIILASAAVLGVTIDSGNPVVEGVLPKWNCRVEGILPPRAAERPMFFIRRPSEKVFTLDDYLKEGRITKERLKLLTDHIKRRSNIIVGGETGSGKTTLVKAIIEKMCEFTPDDRFYIVEDAGEITCHARDVVPIWAAGKDCLKAVGAALRCNVSRIIFGELRYGDVANEVLKAWNSGHTGGITTIHANSALTMLARIRDLLREVIVGELPDVAKSVQLLVHMIPTDRGPIVNEIVETHQADSSTFMEDLEGNNLI